MSCNEFADSDEFVFHLRFDINIVNFHYDASEFEAHIFTVDFDTLLCIRMSIVLISR